MKKWCTGVKLQVMFNEDYKPLGEEGTKLIGQLGIIVCSPNQVPLTYLDWNVVPEDIKSTIWKEIETIALRNSLNQEWHGPAHKTGQTPFAQIRHEMNALGQENDKMSVFTKTRDKNDPNESSVVEEFKDYLARIPEALQTTEVRDKIFHNVLGEDGHRQVNEATQRIEKRLTVEIEKRLKGEIEMRVTGEIERKLDDLFTAHLASVGAQFEFVGGANGTGQGLNVANGQRLSLWEIAFKIVSKMPLIY
ncbi:hypothetical protein Vadar_008931 [Vaccinium darrowii]|uniref:Uncharacterized protein n=1 Tax=Vaccinium darrowii TaxID=229202 RepID=A0ACB7XQD4_9ERIC|nr:hypothetical protein Vadar_008931 [Vaccinium darrowii]